MTWLANLDSHRLHAVGEQKPVIWLGDSLGEMALYYGLAVAGRSAGVRNFSRGLMEIVEVAVSWLLQIFLKCQ
jgi:hypothetical protein